jgi:oligopeptide/dipeptide ABC transporter ATP-binding protein
VSAAVPTPLLEVRDLTVHFPVLRGFLRRRAGTVRAVDGVSFDLRAGETLGLVGESGSGKSTLARALLRLDPPTSGSVRFDGADLARLDAEALRSVRRHIQMIFQDSFASLNPRMRVGAIVREPLDVHGLGEAAARDALTVALLERVGLGARAGGLYPHELSGGQRQRVGIARALAAGPRLVVADEPISALDVSVQAQIVNLLEDLKEERGLTYLFVAHDLSMVRHVCDRVAVMYLGRLVESGSRDDVFGQPCHPYTRALIASIPVPDPERRATRAAPPLEGEVPSPAAPPPGCRFHTRCPFAVARCREEVPELRETAPGHQVACHRSEELA